MKKNFTKYEAIKLKNNYINAFNNLNDLISKLDKLKNDVKDDADYIETEEIIKILKTIPTEDLSREKKGLRIKPLIESGFDNLADIYAATESNLSSIYGISETGAAGIKFAVNMYAKRLKNEVKIQISIDDKTKSKTKLVNSIYKFINYKEVYNQSQNLIDDNKNKINRLINEMNPSTSSIKWLFTGKIKKQLAMDAYDSLCEIVKDGLLDKIDKAISKSKKILKANDTISWEDFSINSIEYFKVIEDIDPGLLGSTDSKYGLPEELARQIQEECYFPDGLLCTLRNYQEWGVKYILHQERVLLGDEMGLGKTIQAIATMVSLKNTGAKYFIVVCPASVVINWCREIVKHSKLRPTKVHGKGCISSFKSWLKNGGVAVTTYETIKKLPLEDDFKISMVVVDEAHYIKNPKANRTINTIELCKHANRLLFMTGTALENNVDEMIGLIEILQPRTASSLRPLAFMAAAKEFRDKAACVYYRRKREDVLKELPELIESKEWCSLNHQEEAIYEESIINHKFADARRVSWNVDNLEYSSKATRLKELVEEAESEGRKVIVFSFFLDTIKKVRELLKDKCTLPINGSVPPAKRQEIIDDFEKSETQNVLVAQIQSGGTGLNIQSASVVIICEPQFKPSIENQAISRAYRMGQSRNVLVYRLLCIDTIDERITDILADKQEIFDAFADESVAAQQSKEIDDKTFGSIINDEIERINKKRGYVLKKVTNKNSSYYDNIMSLSYDDLVKSLLNKYGKVEYDYFCNETCRSKNHKLSRTKEGLVCHHIDEDKCIMLCNDQFALQNSYDYQKADRLVYCNLLEHLLLHIKIIEKQEQSGRLQFNLAGIGGAVQYICKQLNDYYNNVIPTVEWINNCISIINQDYDSYIAMLKRLHNLIKEDDELSSVYSIRDLCIGWNGTYYKNIENDII